MKAVGGAKIPCAYLHFIVRSFLCNNCDDFGVNFDKYTAWESYQTTCSAIKLNSRRHDLTSVERYVDQSRRLFIGDVA